MIDIRDIIEKIRAEAGDPIFQLTHRLNKIAKGESRWDDEKQDAMPRRVLGNIPGAESKQK